MFEQIFNNIDNVLRQEAGCTTELDYTEQTSWMLFLKYLDDLKGERAIEVELEGKRYNFIIDKEHHWFTWAVPKKEDGSFDHDNAMKGVNQLDADNLSALLKLKFHTNRDAVKYLGSLKKIRQLFDEFQMESYKK